MPSISSIRTPLLAIALSALGLSPNAASAAFTTIAVDEYVVDGRYVADVYVGFSLPLSVLLNVFDVSASIQGGWGVLLHDNAGVGGPSWAPQFVTPGAAQLDSFVTIGGMPGLANSTFADPGWGALPGLDGFNQLGIPVGAGWFNSNPPNLQGAASAIVASNLMGQTTYVGLGTMLMRLVVDPDSVGDAGLAFSISGGVTWTTGLGGAIQETMSFSTQLWAIPAPAAGLLLCGLGVCPRRRRRPSAERPLSAPTPAAPRAILRAP
ncbi:MAG TPA: hypothetical protein PKC43_05660 [Phycisphaerales bacterium]|nr:hypothetical protein [Phycisphaerales bacterium]HMP36918.1 hypothetical protein [Phycisphaerales bacterium]